jgi:hypothetical protein
MAAQPQLLYQTVLTKTIYRLLLRVTAPYHLQAICCWAGPSTSMYSVFIYMSRDSKKKIVFTSCSHDSGITHVLRTTRPHVCVVHMFLVIITCLIFNKYCSPEKSYTFSVVACCRTRKKSKQPRNIAHID